MFDTDDNISFTQYPVSDPMLMITNGLDTSSIKPRLTKIKQSDLIHNNNALVSYDNTIQIEHHKIIIEHHKD